MTDDTEEQGRELEREIRESRRFSMDEAIARLAGPGAMSGASPVSEVEQAGTEIGTWLRAHVADPAGALNAVMHRHIKASRMLLDRLDRPLEAVKAYAERLLASDELLKELVREADVEWGRMMEERPFFERGGTAPHPDDPYTTESVRAALQAVFERLAEP